MTREAEPTCVTFKYVITFSKAIDLPVDDLKPDGETLNYNDNYSEKAVPGESGHGGRPGGAWMPS